MKCWGWVLISGCWGRRASQRGAQRCGVWGVIRVTGTNQGRENVESVAIININVFEYPRDLQSLVFRLGV